MKISRKEFFKQSLYSLVEAACNVSAALKPPAMVEPVADEEEQVFVPTDRDDRVAVARNDYCLAGRCGCFTCLERCEANAIHLVIGKGIEIDAAVCTGCGTCAYLCPVTPKGVSLRQK